MEKSTQRAEVTHLKVQKVSTGDQNPEAAVIETLHAWLREWEAGREQQEPASLL